MTTNLHETSLYAVVSDNSLDIPTSMCVFVCHLFKASAVYTTYILGFLQYPFVIVHSLFGLKSM